MNERLRYLIFHIISEHDPFDAGVGPNCCTDCAEALAIRDAEKDRPYTPSPCESGHVFDKVDQTVCACGAATLE